MGLQVAGTCAALESQETERRDRSWAGLPDTIGPRVLEDHESTGRRIAVAMTRKVKTSQPNQHGGRCSHEKKKVPPPVRTRLTAACA
ncbi:hypothetical protein B7463_g492, partial [Scytalidium lignicola]